MLNKDFPHLKGTHRSESCKVTLIPDNAHTRSFAYTEAVIRTNPPYFQFRSLFWVLSREVCYSPLPDTLHHPGLLALHHHRPTTNPKINTLPFKVCLEPLHRNFHHYPIPTPTATPPLELGSQENYSLVVVWPLCMLTNRWGNLRLHVF